MNRGQIQSCSVASKQKINYNSFCCKMLQKLNKSLTGRQNTTAYNTIIFCKFFSQHVATMVCVC